MRLAIRRWNLAKLIQEGDAIAAGGLVLLTEALEAGGVGGVVDRRVTYDPKGVWAKGLSQETVFLEWGIVGDDVYQTPEGGPPGVPGGPLAVEYWGLGRWLEVDM